MSIVFAGALVLALNASAIGQSDDVAKYAQAEALIRKHEWDRGIEILKPLIKGNPVNTKLLNLIGLAYTGKGDWKQADSYFESALEVQPEFVPALKNLAINEIALRDLAPANKHLEAALKIAPDDPVANLYLGRLFYDQSDFMNASDHLRRARNLVARDPALLAILAVSELRAGQLDEAVAVLDSVSPTALPPPLQLAAGVALAEADLAEKAVPYLEAARTEYVTSPDLGYNLALCYFSVKRFTDAITVLRGMQADGQETAESDELLGEAYSANHETQNAVDAFRQAIHLNPEDENNYLEFASLCMDHNAFEDAGKVLSAGLAVKPKSARLIFDRALLSAMQDHYDDAEREFQEAADLDPNSNSGYIGLGVTYLESGNAAKAVPVLRKRLHDHPGDANVSYLLGEALLRSDARTSESAAAEAQTYLESAVHLDAKLVEPHVSLGTIYLRQGKLEEAIVQLEQARALDPRVKSAYSHLAVAYRRLGNQEKAKEILIMLKDMNDKERTGTKRPVNFEEPAQ